MLAPGLLADLARAEELVLVHPRPDLLGEVLLLVLERGGGRVQHLAADPQDLVLRGLAGGDLVHVLLELGRHLRRRHPRHVLVERLVHRDPRLRGLGRVRVDVAAVVELLDDVGAGRLGAEAALLHQLDQLALADPRRRLGLLVDDPRLAVERQLLALLELRDLVVGGAGVGVDRGVAGVDDDRAADEVGLRAGLDVGAGRLGDHRRREGGEEAADDELVDAALRPLERVRVDRLRRVDRRVVGGLLLAAGRPASACRAAPAAASKSGIRTSEVTSSLVLSDAG